MKDLLTKVAEKCSQCDTPCCTEEQCRTIAKAFKEFFGLTDEGFKTKIKCCWNCDMYDTFACVCQLRGKQIDHLEYCEAFKTDEITCADCDRKGCEECKDKNKFKYYRGSKVC